MPVQFVHKHAPVVNLGGGFATVAILAFEVDGEERTILDDQEGDTHDVPVDIEAEGASAQALPGVRWLVADVALRRFGLTLAPEDITQAEGS